MARHGHVMLTVLVGCQPYILPVCLVSTYQTSRGLERDRRPRCRAAISYGEHFFVHRVQADYLRALCFVEMTAYGIAYLLMQLVEPVGLSEDRGAQRARRPASLGGSITTMISLIASTLRAGVVKRALSPTAANGSKTPSSSRARTRVGVPSWRVCHPRARTEHRLRRSDKSQCRIIRLE
jgi:hypothetical protein